MYLEGAGGFGQSLRDWQALSRRTGTRLDQPLEHRQARLELTPRFEQFDGKRGTADVHPQIADEMCRGAQPHELPRRQLPFLRLIATRRDDAELSELNDDREIDRGCAANLGDGEPFAFGGDLRLKCGVHISVSSRSWRADQTAARGASARRMRAPAASRRGARQSTAADTHPRADPPAGRARASAASGPSVPAPECASAPGRQASAPLPRRQAPLPTGRSAA